MYRMNFFTTNFLKDLETLTTRMREIEQEAQLIKKMQTDVEKQMNMSTSSTASPSAVSLEEKMEADSRSVYVGNVSLRKNS